MKKPIHYSDFYQINIDKIFFIDIETVSEADCFENLDAINQQLWEKKATSLAYQNKYKDTTQPLTASHIYTKEAGIHSEFSKIVCISVGFLKTQPEPQRHQFYVTSFYGPNEPEILQNFYALLDQNADFYLCAHNGFNFDFPFICRRSIIHHIKMPEALKILQKKPWNTYWLLDTMDLWKFNGGKNFTSLETLAHVLDFPSPKNTSADQNTPPEQKIDGSSVHEFYYHKQDFQTIREYCERDCLAVAQIVLRLREYPIITPEAFHSKDNKTVLKDFKHKDPEHNHS